MRHPLPDFPELVIHTLADVPKPTPQSISCRSRESGRTLNPGEGLPEPSRTRTHAVRSPHRRNDSKLFGDLLYRPRLTDSAASDWIAVPASDDSASGALGDVAEGFSTPGARIGPGPIMSFRHGWIVAELPTPHKLQATDPLGATQGPIKGITVPYPGTKSPQPTS